MLVSRISHRSLSNLCDRIGLAFDVGHNPHRAFEREAGASTRLYRRRMADIASRVEAGGSLTDAIRAQGNYFPDNFVQMVSVGERTGRLETVLARLSNYYKDMDDLRGEFRSSIMWPVVQLILTVIVVGLMIYVPSMVAPDAGDILDMLGIGLVGARGLKIYCLCVGGVALVLFGIYLAARNGYLGFLTNWATQLPLIRALVNVFAEARFVQTLALSLDSGLDSWHSVDLAFKSAASPRYDAKADRARAAVREGRELHVILEEAGVLSKDTIEAVRLGEESGRLPETLDKQFLFLRAEVKSLMTKLVYLASSVIWTAIVTVLVVIIFRVFTNYLGNIEGKLDDYMSQ